MKACQARNFLTQAKAKLAECGFDIFQPFPLSRYNQYYKSQQKTPETLLKPYEKLKKNSNSDDDCVAILIGNTKNLWPKFKGHLVENHLIDKNGNLQQKNPLDSYTMDCVKKVMESCDEKQPTSTFYSHEFIGNYPRVAIQVAGQVSGFAFYENGISYLSFHPEIGNWFAYRAVVLLDDVVCEGLEDLFVDSLDSMERVFELSLERHCQLTNQIIPIGMNFGKLVESLKSKLSAQLNQAMKENMIEEWISLRDCPIKCLENQSFFESFIQDNSLTESEQLLIKEWITQLVESWKSYRYEESQILYHYVKKTCLLTEDSKCC